LGLLGVELDAAAAVLLREDGAEVEVREDVRATLEGKKDVQRRGGGARRGGWSEQVGDLARELEPRELVRARVRVRVRVRVGVRLRLRLRVRLRPRLRLRLKLLPHHRIHLPHPSPNPRLRPVR
jgi:hypothetical protein